jgi:hypothetical protein
MAKLKSGTRIYGTAVIDTSLAVGTGTATQTLHVQGTARITGAIYDSANSAGIAGQVLQSTGSVTGAQWISPWGLSLASTYNMFMP